MRVVNRGEHIQDEVEVIGLPVGQTRRRIGHFLNYRTEHDKAWRVAKKVLNAEGPHRAQGMRFAHHGEHSLETFLGEMDIAGNSTTTILRIAEAPHKAIRITAVGVNAVSWTLQANNKTLKWTNLWPRTNMNATTRRGGYHKLLRLKRAGHPSSFAWDLRVPENFELLDRPNAWVFKRGRHRIKLAKGFAWDSTQGNAGGIGPDNTYNVPVTNTIVSDETPGDGFRYIRIRMAVDVTGATYPVFVDPTATISGTANIDDASTRSSGANNNYGGHSALYCRSSDYKGLLLAVSTGSIPAGTISAFRWHYNVANQNSTTVTAYRVLPANTWVEGSGTGAAPETGACCHNYAKHDTQAWAGSAGCLTSGTDYDASGVAIPNPTTYAFESATLDSAWPTGWRDATFANTGMVLHNAGTSLLGVHSSNHPGTPCYFEIDHAPANAGGFLALEER